MKRLALLSILFIFATAGPNLGGTGADDSGTGSVTWLNPMNSQSENGVAATAAFVGGVNHEGDLTHGLKITNFGFSVPGGSTITGLVDEAKIGGNDGDGDADGITTSRIFGIKSGSATADGGVANNAINVALTWTAITGSTELYGTTWSVSDVNASTSGFEIQVIVGAFVDNPVSFTAQIDAFRRTIYYTEAGTGVKKRAIGYGNGKVETEVLCVTK